MHEPVLSVILPMYNESEVVEPALAAVSAVLAPLGLPFEILCVDDGSRDDTFARLSRAAALDSRVVPLQLSRNYGKEAALAAGLERARGQAILTLDADLQHPPRLIPAMVAAWQEGADVVSCVKRDRGDEGALYKLMAAAFNRLMGGAAGADFGGASDFKLLDRQVVDAILACPERHRFFRGLVAWVGFTTREIPFEVAERVAGTTKWSTRALIRYSIRNLLSFSAFPLRLIAWLGMLMLSFTGLLGVWTLFRWIRGDSLAGFPTVILLQLIFGGLLLTSLGVIALYLAEMYEELKGRPAYLFKIAGPPRTSTPEPAPSSASSADSSAATTR